MRATRLPYYVSRMAVNGPGIAVCVAVVWGVSALAAPAAHGGVGLIPHLGHVVLGQQPPTPGSKKPKPKQKGATAKAKEAAELDPALKRDPVALPPDYQVPPDPLPDLTIVKELPIVQKVDSPREPGYKEWREHRDKLKKYNDLLRKGSFTDKNSEREILRYGLKDKLAQMTQRSILYPTDEERKKVADAEKAAARRMAPTTINSIRDAILADLRDTNAFNGQFEIRDAFLDLICEECPKLLDNNFFVRFNIAEILSSINNRDADVQKNIVEEPCFRATRPLLELVNDPKQSWHYKLHPVGALAKICRHKLCKPEDRFAIIDCLTAQMAAAKTLPDWYGMRVAESLCQLGEPDDRAKQPVAVIALVNALKDKAYPIRVRVEAAHSLGRVTLDRYKKADDIAVEILRLSEQMAGEYEKSQQNPIWKVHFLHLYRAFRPEDATERNEQKGLLAQVESKPVLAGTKTVVNEAYQLFLPLARNVLNGKAEIGVPDQLRKIKTWFDARAKPPGNGNVATGTTGGASGSTTGM